MKNTKITSLMLLAFTIVLSSCGKNKNGVWEMYRAVDNIYVCFPEKSDYMKENADRVYWEDKSCSVLGYTEKGSSAGSWHYVNSKGERYPGANGAFKNRGGSSSGSGSNCDPNNYNGPNFNIQIDSQCKTAHAYKCAGNQQGVQTACGLYYSYESQWQGPGSFPRCPYCH